MLQIIGEYKSREGIDLEKNSKRCRFLNLAFEQAIWYIYICSPKDNW